MAEDRKIQITYRQISVVCYLGITLEKIMDSHLEIYLFRNNVLPLHQFGFRRGISTKTQYKIY